MAENAPSGPLVPGPHNDITNDKTVLPSIAGEKLLKMSNELRRPDELQSRPVGLSAGAWHPSDMDTSATNPQADSESPLKREPLRSKRYVPPKYLDVNNLSDSKPAADTPSSDPSETPKSSAVPPRVLGPSSKTLDRSAVLALPAAPQPGSVPELHVPSPRQRVKKHTSIEETVPTNQPILVSLGKVPASFRKAHGLGKPPVTINKPPVTSSKPPVTISKPPANQSKAPDPPSKALVPEPKKAPKPQVPVLPPARSLQPAIPLVTSNRLHFPVKKAVVEPPPVERKRDARSLTAKVWMLEQLLKNGDADGSAIQSIVNSEINLVQSEPRLKRLWAIWRIGDLVRCEKVPATPEDLALLDAILPPDKDRTASLLLNLKTEAVIQHLRVTDDRADRNWKLFSWSLRLFFTGGASASDGLKERRAELLAAEKARRKQVAAKALLAQYPLESLLQELRAVVQEAKSDQPTFLEQVYDDVGQQKYVPSPPPTVVTDVEAAAVAEKDALENPIVLPRTENGAQFSGRQPGLVDMDELYSKAGGKGKGRKLAPGKGVNGLYGVGERPRAAGPPQPVSRRNLAFKPGKHKPAGGSQGPAEMVIERPAGTPIRERWWEKQLRGPDGKFFTKKQAKVRMENGSGGEESGAELRGKKRKMRGGESTGERMSLLGPGRAEGTDAGPDERTAGGLEEPGAKKKRTFELGDPSDGATSGGSGEQPRKTSRERKSAAQHWRDYEWWDSEDSDDDEEEHAEGGKGWAVLGDDDENDGHDGLCKVCQQPGTLLLCEGCPSVYHCKCAGLGEMPLEDKWWCPECQAKQSADWTRGFGGVRLVPGSGLSADGQGGRMKAGGDEMAAAMLVMLGDGRS